MKLSEKRYSIPVRTDTVTEEDIVYRYTLFFSQPLHAPTRSPAYFIQAETLDPEGRCIEKATETLLDPGYAMVFYEICREHRVSPVHLHDVAEDFSR